jgi:hypothetical protein
MPTYYLMRMVDEFVRVMARVLFFREMKQYVNAIDELDNLSKMMTGFDLGQIKELGIDGVKSFFELSNFSNVEKVFYSAKALKEEAAICFEQGNVDEGMKSMAMALGLFEMIKNSGLKDYPGLEEEISIIKRRVN